MTFTLLNIDNQQQIIVSIIFNNITKQFRVVTESTNDEQATAFICTPGSTHYSLIEALFKNPPPVLIKIQDGKFEMKTIFLDINDEINIIKSLTYNITTKSYKIDTEKLENWEKATSPSSCLPESTNFAFTESLFKNPLPTKVVSMYQTISKIANFRVNPIEITLHGPGDKKTHLRADIRCKWTPFFLQGEHFVTTIFWIPDGNPLQVRLPVTENQFPIILIPITVRTEELANLFVTLRFPGRWIEGKTKAWTIFWIIWTRNLGDLTG